MNLVYFAHEVGLNNLSLVIWKSILNCLEILLNQIETEIKPCLIGVNSLRSGFCYENAEIGKSLIGEASREGWKYCIVFELYRCHGINFLARALST